MYIKQPNAEDQRKLHAEINQLANQRFLLVTVALGLTGTVAAQLIRHDIKIGWGISIVCTGLTVILGCLAFLGYQSKCMIRVLTCYLIETKASIWEQHWADYRKYGKKNEPTANTLTETPLRYPGYSRPAFWMFSVLIIGFSICPLGYWRHYVLCEADKQGQTSLIWTEAWPVPVYVGLPIWVGYTIICICCYLHFKGQNIDDEYSENWRRALDPNEVYFGAPI